MHAVTSCILRVSEGSESALVCGNKVETDSQVPGVDVQEIIERKATVLNLSKDSRNPQPSKDDIENADRVFQFALNMLNLEECVPIERALSEIPGESGVDCMFKDMILEILMVNAWAKFLDRKRESIQSRRVTDMKAGAFIFTCSIP